MEISDRAQEVLERLWIELIEQKKDSCSINILKDKEATEELNRLNYIKIKDDQVKLTDKGKDESRSCVRRHRLAERLMADIFDLKKSSVHEQSCKFEHLLQEGLDDNICTLLGHPKRCPHGTLIPPGNCCKDVKRTPKKMLMPLFELEIDKKAKIAYLHTQDHSTLQKLIAIGVLPKTEIKLIQKFPSYVFQIGKSQFAVDKDLASHIYVKPV